MTKLANEISIYMQKQAGIGSVVKGLFKSIKKHPFKTGILASSPFGIKYWVDTYEDKTGKPFMDPSEWKHSFFYSKVNKAPEFVKEGSSMQKKADINPAYQLVNTADDIRDAHNYASMYKTVSDKVSDAYNKITGGKSMPWDKYVQKFNKELNPEIIGKTYFASTQKLRDLWSKTGLNWATNHPWQATTLGAMGAYLVGRYLWNKFNKDDDEKRRYYEEW